VLGGSVAEQEPESEMVYSYCLYSA